MPGESGTELHRFFATLSVSVHADEAASPEMQELTARLSRLPGVMAVQHDCRKGRVHVRYDMRKSAARLLHAVLLDRVAGSDPPKVSPAARAELCELGLYVIVAHEVPGRVRLRIEQREGGLQGVPERVAARLAALSGVLSARPSASGDSIVVTFTPGATSTDSLLRALRTGLPDHAPEPRDALTTTRRQLIKTGCTALVFCVALTGLAPLPIVLAGVTLTAIPSFRRAFESARQRRIKVDMLDATAIAVCILQSDPISAGAITTLLAIGDVILDRTQDRARLEISKLIQLDDGETYILDRPDEPPRLASPRELQAGTRIVIYPGARIPADGVIVDGAVTADEKAITGESMPRERLIGDEVLAASVAVHGQAVVEVTRAGGDTTAARIVQILQGVGMKPMTLQQNAERSADRLVLPTFGIAVAAFALTGAIQRLVCVLITDFGTGVRIAVPTTVLASMTLGARNGVLIKGAQSIERLNEVDTIIFDKTGTLTRGVPEVTDVIRLGELTEQEIVAFAAAAETNQAHPLADAIRRHAQALGTPPWQAENGSESYRIGLGLETRVEGKFIRVGNPRLMRELGVDATLAGPARAALAERGVSSVLVAIDDKLVGVLGIADEPREESREVIRVLRDGGRRKIVLLSGDARAPVEAVARHCGIDEAVAEVLPHEKASVVKALKANGRKVAMVGDGINDAPALALADVGISLHGATAVARETADVVLLDGGLERLPEVFTLSRDAMKRVRDVLGIVIAPNAAAIVVGALGFISPVTASVLNNGSTIAAALYAALPLIRPTESR
jgi:heavy metal translocating P-type ATPase